MIYLSVLFKYRKLEPACDEDFKTDENEDGTAEDIGFACDAGTDLFADLNTEEADPEGDERDEKCRKKCHGKSMLRNGKAYGKRVDGGCDALNNEGADSGLLIGNFTAVASFDAFDEHFTADETEKTECDPRNP